MDAIILEENLRKTLEKDAEQEGKDINDIVNEALAAYVRERQRAKLDKEIATYRDIYKQLRQKYLGQWVAIYEQKLVDHDLDGSILHQRIRAKYGQTSVLIRQVTEQPNEEFWVRTPSSGKTKS